MDLDWFCEEIEELADRLNISEPETEPYAEPPTIVLTHVNGAEVNGTESETVDVSTRQRSKWSADGPIEFATESTTPECTTPTVPIPPNTAFEIPITPPNSKNVEKSPLRRNKTTPKATRPHTIHVDGSGDNHKTQPTRNRTNSDNNEQDENKPPEKGGAAMAFEISDTTPKKQRDILAKKRDRVIKRQQEREEELRRKKFEFEEQKRILEREKSVKEEIQNDFKKLENERREAILKNHKATKATPTKPKKQPEKKHGVTIPVDPFSPSRVTRSQSSTLNRHEPKEKDWDTLSCVSTLTTTRLFREPSTKSNRQLVQMALKYQCLPGPVNAASRKAADEALNMSGAYHFMALYKQNKYKGLYEVEQVEEILRITKIHGTGPKEVQENMIEELLKYNSGMKSFQSVDSRTLSPAIDGFRLSNACWLTRRPRTTPAPVK